MRRNQMRRLLEGDRPALGAWTYLSDPALIEIMAAVGLDYTCIDMEHNGLDMEGLQSHLRAAYAGNLAAIVRVWKNEPELIMRILDCGADGVVVPHVDTAEEARAAVSACRYPPLGHRGWSSHSRAGEYGAHGAKSEVDFAQQINRDVVCGVYIEDIEAVKNIDEIVSVPGVDFCQIGPSDLTASMGLTGHSQRPEVGEAINRVHDACMAAGVKLGMTVEHGAYSISYPVLEAQGYKALIVGSDAGMVIKGFEARLKQLRGKAKDL